MFGLQPKLSREHAEKLVRQGKTAAAIEIYERLLETDRGNSNLIMPLGDLYVRAGRNSDAARLFRGLAEQLDTDGYHGRAAALWRKILKFEPDSLEYESRLARSLLALGSRIEAATALHQVIERAENQKQWKAVAEAYALLAKAETPRAETCLPWGRALAQSGEKASAQARLLAGLELATTAQTPQLSLAASLLQELERLDPRWPPYGLARAELAAWSGDAAGVLKWLPEPGSLPDAAAAVRAWRLAAQAGDLDLAGAWARSAMETGADETARDFGLFLLERNDTGRLTAWVCDSRFIARDALRPHWLALYEAWNQRGPLPPPALQAWINLVAGRDAALETQLRLRLQPPSESKPTPSNPVLPAANPAPADVVVIEPEPADISAIVDLSSVHLPPVELSSALDPQPVAALTSELNPEFADTVIELDLSQPWTEDDLDVAADSVPAEEIQTLPEPASTLDLVSNAAEPTAQIQPLPASALPQAQDAQPQPAVAAIPPASMAAAPSPAFLPPVESPIDSSPPAADPFLQDLALELNGASAPPPSVSSHPANRAAPRAPAVTTEVLAGVLAEFERGLPELGGQPSGAEQHMHTGMALREMGLWEEAIAELQRAHQAWPPAPDFNPQRRTCAAYLGECFTRLELPESALPWYRRVLADPAIPKSAWQGAAYETAALLEQLGEFSEAARLLQQIYAENVDFLDVGERLRRLRSRLAATASA